MSDLDALEDLFHKLDKKVAGMQPLVVATHESLPRITKALEVLAGVSARLESNEGEHKRIHFRIADSQKVVDEVKDRYGGLRRDFDQLQKEHIECLAVRRAEGEVRKSSTWLRLKHKAEEVAVNWVVVLLLAFALYAIGPKLIDFVATLPVAVQSKADEQGRGEE